MSARSKGFLSLPSARLGVVVIVALTVVALSAPLLAPLAPNQQLDPKLSASRPPLTRMLRVVVHDEGGARTVLADSAELRGEELLLTRAGETELIESGDATIDSLVFVLGTDRLGRDLLSRILYGARVSLTVGLMSAVLALTIGLMIGGAAALGGTVLDAVLMRCVDGLLALPHLLLVLTLAVLFEPRPTLLVLLIGGTSWMTLSRLVRAELMTLKQRDFVLASRGIGQRWLAVFFRHLFPNILNTILVTGSLLVGDAILVESALSFLGLGAAGELPSWGRMIAHGRGDLVTQWWLSTFPGLAIVTTVLAFNLVADGARDALDPRARRPGLEP